MRAEGKAGSGPADATAAHEANPRISVERVTRRFGPVTAVDSLSLTIGTGEIFCLLGGSGCGKTTLMRMIAGFEEPDEGRIRLDGADLTGVPPHRRPVNMMFQSYALFPHLSVADNIGFGLRQAGLERAEIARRVGALVELVQLQGLERRRPDQLSGGQKQRVALARALARRPKVLLLDEPLGALDKKTREQTQLELINIQKEIGATFILVTHDHEEAMVMASRIGVMEAGRLVQVGAPPEVYETPASRSVAALIGDVNFIEAMALGGGTWRFESAQFAGGLETAAGGRDVAAGQTVTVAVRPEKVRVDPAGHAGGDGANQPNTAPGTVTDAAYLGDWTMLHVRLADGSTIRASQANTSRRLDGALARGAAVTVGFAPESAVVLTQ